jgi:hypothetical protein
VLPAACLMYQCYTHVTSRPIHSIEEVPGLTHAANTMHNGLGFPLLTSYRELFCLVVCQHLQQMPAVCVQQYAPVCTCLSANTS